MPAIVGAPSPRASVVLVGVASLVACCAPTVRCWAPPVATVPIAARARSRPAVAMPMTAAARGGLELWLDLRRTTTASTDGEEGDPAAAAAAIGGSRLALVDAAIVDGDGDGDGGRTSAAAAAIARRYVVEADSDDGTRPPRMFLRGDDRPAGAVVDVSAPSGQDAALGLVGSVEWIVVTCRGRGDGGGNSGEDRWIMIPVENLVSSCQNTGTKIAAVVDRAGDVGGLAGALELGVDAICVGAADAASDDGLWDALIDAREERRAAAAASDRDDARGDGAEDGPSRPGGPSIVRGTCRRVSSAGGKGSVLANRVCIDLVQLLAPTEGCWVGSSAKVAALVLSEAAESSFVPSRPFRVNAGPVHSYVVMGDGTSTKYLSELRAGDEVLVHDAASGRERAVAVGRLKVEVRPCVQVELVAPGPSTPAGRGASRGQVFLQQAETVRLGRSMGDDSFIRITDLECKEDVQPSEVLLRVTGMGTHVGKAYSGKVNER